MDDEMPPEPEGLGETDDGLEPIDLKPMWLRRLTWDIIACREAPDMQKRLGLVPSTEEAAELEHVESHKRMNYVEALEPAVDTFSDYVSEVLSTYMVETATEGVKSEVTEAILKKLISQNSGIVKVGTLAIIAQLMDTGVLGYTAKIIGKRGDNE